MKSLFEHNGGTYHKRGDYLIPNLLLSESQQCWYLWVAAFEIFKHNDTYCQLTNCIHMIILNVTR